MDLGEQEVDQEQMILERRQLQIMHSKLEIFADNIAGKSKLVNLKKLGHCGSAVHDDTLSQGICATNHPGGS